MKAWLLKILRVKKKCSHVFNTRELKMTGILEKEQPERGDYQGWVEYFRDYYEHESITKRVTCPCVVCGEIFYAHCGLDLPGKLVRF